MPNLTPERQNPEPEPRKISRRRFLALATVAPLAAAGCKGGFNIFGYQVGPGARYDENIRTVYVPLFNNRAFQTTPYRGIEVDITQAVVREIGKSTTFRVTSDYSKADTELLGNVVSITRTLLNINQENFTRQGEVVVQVDVVWRDLRTGEILSNPRPRPIPGRPTPVPPPNEPLPIPFDPDVPLPPDGRALELAKPVRLVASGRYLPELGETNVSANLRIDNQIAIQIVWMMERRW
jgi:hypothetical protein